MKLRQTASMKPAIAPSLIKDHWRDLLMAVVVFGSLAFMLAQTPFGQSPKYHHFADQRTFFGIANFLDVTSNLAFFICGVAGLRICLRSHPGSTRTAWIVLFAGVTLVSVGSAYYHSEPTSETLVWDRLPMTIGFMGLFAALLGEYVSDRLGAFLLAPALLLGLASVAYWRWSDDLRFYYWIQLVPLLTIPVAMSLYRPKYSHRWLLLVALGWYALAKVAEANDSEIFALSQGIISGHTIKHLLSALACLSIVWMIQRQTLLERGPSENAICAVPARETGPTSKN
jgi:Ceramidase